jgi:hypothetical protein
MEGQVVILRKKMDRIPTFVAAKAVVNLLLNAHGKRRRFLFVEGTEPQKVFSGAPQLHVLRDEIENIYPFKHRIK